MKHPKFLGLFVLALFLVLIGSCGKDDPCEQSTFYLDSDGDGEGDSTKPQKACKQPDNHVANANDPDDSNADIFSNCTKVTYYLDNDGDTFGDSSQSMELCDGVAPSDKYVSDNSDTNDEDINDFPGCAKVTYYLDDDGDTYGDPDQSIELCKGVEVPEKYVSNNADCDDNNPNNYLGAQFVVFQDLDNDGLGNQDVSQTVNDCEPIPDGYVLDNTDCNDALPLFNANDWVGNYNVERTKYVDENTTSVINFSTCTAEAVDGDPNSLRLIAFWSSDQVYYTDHEIIINVNPCNQTATWNQGIAIGYYPHNPFPGDMVWERKDNGLFGAHNILLDPSDEYGWCTLDFENKTIQLFGLTRIPDHQKNLDHLELNFEKAE